VYGASDRFFRRSFLLPRQPDGEIATTKDETNGRTYYVPELNDVRLGSFFFPFVSLFGFPV